MKSSTHSHQTRLVPGEDANPALPWLLLGAGFAALVWASAAGLGWLS